MKNFTEEHKKALSEARKGKTHSEETKKKIRASNRAAALRRKKSIGVDAVLSVAGGE